MCLKPFLKKKNIQRLLCITVTRFLLLPYSSSASYPTQTGLNADITFLHSLP